MSDGMVKFDADFEEKLVQAMLVDYKFAEQLMDVLDPDLLDLKYAKEISKIILRHYAQYGTFPSVSLLCSICQQEVDNVILRKECLTYLEKIQKRPLNGDTGYVQEKTLSFFRTQAVKNAIIEEVVPKLKDGVGLEKILPILEKAINRGTERNVGYEYEEDQELRFVEEETSKVPTPWAYLNELLHGGWGDSRLTTWIGGSGAGKSHLLVNCGVGALTNGSSSLNPQLAAELVRRGRVVVHYTLELSEIDVARRYDAALTGVDINFVPMHKAKILETLKTVLPEGSRLIIKEYPMKKASVQTIKAHLSRLKLQGIIPDILIIDYGDLLSPVSNMTDKRHGLEEIWIDLKSLAQEMKIHIVTATQTNRGGYDAEVVKPTDISEDFSKVMHSDIIITMARNMEQKAVGIGKMYLAKNRQGKDGQIFSYALDTDKCKIDIFELTEPPEEEVHMSLKDHLADFLKKKGEIK